LVSIGIVAVVIGVLLEQVVLAQSAFKVGRLREEVFEAEARHQELLLEATRLGSPGRIERFARDQLGMVEASRIEYVEAKVRGLSHGSLVARSRRAKPLRATEGAALGESP
jgi:cell division protein FtsL